ncbi:MAG: hypothetical protein QNJ46_32230 [Leptolyngbyaceae cyanobacterium MO_188.B28]|nr:hypothetical protein [Leptolyngbyaceae cyanobacterium MO_188.B28]
MAVSTSPLELFKSPEEKRLEEDRIHDVLLLLEHLVQREEATVKIILDCLYDVGSVNLLNRKLHNRQLNQLVKSVAIMSKPAFRIIAMRWFKRNCPQLITDWLHSQVTFEDSVEQSDALISQVSDSHSDSLPPSENREIQRLRTQVRWLTGLLIIALSTLGSAVIWLGHHTDQQLLQSQPSRIQVSEP